MDPTTFCKVISGHLAVEESKTSYKDIRTYLENYHSSILELCQYDPSKSIDKIFSDEDITLEQELKILEKGIKGLKNVEEFQFDLQHNLIQEKKLIVDQSIKDGDNQINYDIENLNQKRQFYKDQRKSIISRPSPLKKNSQMEEDSKRTENIPKEEDDEERNDYFKEEFKNQARRTSKIIQGPKWKNLSNKKSKKQMKRV